jgi:3-methyladenine DNA glycosylase AlkD
MFSVLTDIKKDIQKDIKRTEDEWTANPNNDYYFAEILGLRRALNYVSIAESKEYTALDKWAQSINERELNESNIG